MEPVAVRHRVKRGISSFRRRAGIAGAASLLLAVAMLGSTPPVVTAAHGGKPVGSLLSCDRPVNPPRCVSVGDDSRHRVYIDPSVPAELANALRRTMAEDYGTTTLVLIEQTRVTGLTDVIVFAGDHGQNGAAGWVYCPSDAPQGTNARGDRWCRHQELHFNLNVRYAVYFGDDASRDYMACHELGHTIGLRHWGNPPHSDGPPAATCMNADTPNGPVDLHQFDRDHLNAYYPAPDQHLLRCLSQF
jgi:hypothetical protein